MTTPKLEQKHLDALDNVIRAFQMLGKHISVLPLVELAAILRGLVAENERLSHRLVDHQNALRAAESMAAEDERRIAELSQYTSHGDSCPGTFLPPGICECGLSDLLAPTPPQAPAVPAEPVPRKSSYGLPEDIERKIHLWFFRDLDEPLRFKLFRLFEMHEDEMEPMGRQSRALNSLLYSLRTAPAPQQAAVPDGWKLVPERPTPEMIRAVTLRTRLAGREPYCWQAWELMLAAAPEPEAQTDRYAAIRCKDGSKIHQWERLSEVQSEIEPSMLSGWQRCKVCGKESTYSAAAAPHLYTSSPDHGVEE